MYIKCGGYYMELINKTPREVKRSDGTSSGIWCVAVCRDNNIYYGALVDPKTWIGYIEEMGVSMRNNEDLSGWFTQITDDKEWKTITDFFNKHKVFDKFFKANNWVFARNQGKLTKKASKAKKKLLDG